MGVCWTDTRCLWGHLELSYHLWHVHPERKTNISTSLYLFVISHAFTRASPVPLQSCWSPCDGDSLIPNLPLTLTDHSTLAPLFLFTPWFIYLYLSGCLWDAFCPLLPSPTFLFNLSFLASLLYVSTEQIPLKWGSPLSHSACSFNCLSFSVCPSPSSPPKLYSLTSPHAHPPYLQTALCLCSSAASPSTPSSLLSLHLYFHPSVSLSNVVFSSTFPLLSRSCAPHPNRVLRCPLVFGESYEQHFTAVAVKRFLLLSQKHPQYAPHPC